MTDLLTAASDYLAALDRWRVRELDSYKIALREAEARFRDVVATGEAERVHSAVKAQP